MKSLKYLNGVLTAIAVCLIILTISVIGAFPKAEASSNANHFVNSPLRKEAAPLDVGDLISFRRAADSQEIYISKSNVTCIYPNSFGAKTEIHLTDGGFVIVNGHPSDNEKLIIGDLISFQRAADSQEIYISKSKVTRIYPNSFGAKTEIHLTDGGFVIVNGHPSDNEKLINR